MTQRKSKPFLTAVAAPGTSTTYRNPNHLKLPSDLFVLEAAIAELESLAMLASGDEFAATAPEHIRAARGALDLLLRPYVQQARANDEKRA
jgi:hypothetical protein